MKNPSPGPTVALLVAVVLGLGAVSAANAQGTARRGSRPRRPSVANTDPNNPPLPESGGAANASALTAPGAGGFVEPGANLPFRMVWGDPPERLQRSLAGGGTKVTDRRVSRDGRREIWTVEGLLRAGPKLQGTVLTFLDRALAGVELRYGAPDWTEEKFNEAMGTLRRQLEKDMGGPGELVNRGTSPAPAPNVSPSPSPSPTPETSPASPVGGEATPAPPAVQQILTGYSWKKGD